MYEGRGLRLALVAGPVSDGLGLETTVMTVVCDVVRIRLLDDVDHDLL